VLPSSTRARSGSKYDFLISQFYHCVCLALHYLHLCSLGNGLGSAIILVYRLVHQLLHQTHNLWVIHTSFFFTHTSQIQAHWHSNGRVLLIEVRKYYEILNSNEVVDLMASAVWMALACLMLPLPHPHCLTMLSMYPNITKKLGMCAHVGA
jgi:hypothetical protein